MRRHLQVELKVTAGHHHRPRAVDGRTRENRQLLVHGLVFVLISGCSESTSESQFMWTELMGAPTPTSEESHLQRVCLVNRENQEPHGLRSAPTRRVGPSLVTTSKYFIATLDKKKRGWPSHLLPGTISSGDMPKFVKEREKGRSHELAGKRFRFEHWTFRDFGIKSEVFWTDLRLFSGFWKSQLPHSKGN